MLRKSWYLESCSRTSGSGRPSDWAEFCESSAADPGQLSKSSLWPGNQNPKTRGSSTMKKTTVLFSMMLLAGFVCLPNSLRASGKLEGHLASLRSEEHTSELQSPVHLVCRLLLEKKKKINNTS